MGSAEAAAVDAIMVREVITMGPGSGEGIAHLFVHRNRQVYDSLAADPTAVLSVRERSGTG